MTLADVQKIHEAIGEREPHQLIAAANLALEFSETGIRVSDAGKAELLLRQLCQSFLDEDDFIMAGALLFSAHLFNPGPKFTRDIIEAYVPTNQLLLQGSNGSSKSWIISLLAYLEFWRDPEYTMVKVAAVNEDHLKSTLMANIRNFHRSSALPIQNCTDNDMYVGLEGGLPDMGITGVLFPQGQEGSGRIRGYRPKPIRKVAHPRFGMMSRTRFFGDEGQSWKAGPFKDFGSLMSGMDGPDPVKIVIAYNPDEQDRPVVKQAMPIQGWNMADFAALYKWKSKEGWDVLRLDASLSENVVAQKIVYPGLQTYEGYLKFVQGGGDTSATYFCNARGWPPMKGAVNIVIQSEVPNKWRGEATFIEEPVKWLTADLAYQGEDFPVATTGRYGLASGWTDQHGTQIVFMSHADIRQRQPKHVLQHDQQFKIANSTDPTECAIEIKRLCENLGVKPEYCAVDATGNGFGTYSHLRKYWGPVVAIFWNQKATDVKVLNEDPMPASSLYGNIISEMWFTVRRWFEAGVIIISPLVNTSPLFQQMITRRYLKVRAGLLQVEAKKEYKSRGNPSPDEADSFIMAPHLIRMAHPVLPGLHVESTDGTKDEKETREEHKPVNPEYLETGQTGGASYMQ